MDYKTATQTLLDNHVPGLSKMFTPDGNKGSMQERIENAMNEYAQQEAIMFGEWTSENNWAYDEVGKVWYNTQEELKELSATALFREFLSFKGDRK